MFLIIFCGFLAPEKIIACVFGEKVLLLQNSMVKRTKGPKLCGANTKVPAELWALCSFPRKFLVQK